MSKKVTIEQIEHLAVQLAPQEQLALVARICEKLSAIALSERSRQERIKVVGELLAEVEDLEDDSQGETDAAEIIRRMRDARITHLCQKNA